MPHYGMNRTLVSRLTEIAIELEEMRRASEGLRWRLSLVRPILINTIGFVEVEARKARDAAIEAEARAEAQAEAASPQSGPKACRFPCIDLPVPPAVPFELKFNDSGELLQIIYPTPYGVCQLVRYGHADKGMIHAKHRFASSVADLASLPESEFKRLCEPLPYGGGTGWDVTPKWVKDLLFKGWVNHD